MNFGKKTVSKEAAIEIATANVKLRKNTENVDISEVEENEGGWIIKGTCPSDEEENTWAEKFEIVIDNKGKVKSSDYSLRWLKNEDDTWTIQSKPPTSEVAPAEKVPMKKAKETSKDLPPQEVEFQPTAQEEHYEPSFEPAFIQEQKIQPLTENMRFVEGTLRKIQDLKATRKNLDLELKKLNKAAIAQVNSLENEVNTIKEEIRKMRLRLTEVTGITIGEQTTSDIELAVSRAE